ncbi:MAG: efflux RND transporter periplasmic adaptor subunit [Kiritimatiellaceae bacterium]|nr:efflux RND transporter periplasmic adaptor subunit [Kiritimatiellaceae bacterium]
MIKKFVSTVVIIGLSAFAGWYVHGLYGGKPKTAGMPPMAMARPPMPPAAVTVQVLKEQSLQPVEEYIAKVEPVQQVTIRPQISGTIEAVHFKEGDFVKAGDRLFTIQPDSYWAAIAVREAELAQAEAALSRAEKYYDRIKSADARSISKTSLDTAESDCLQAKAAVKQTEANLNLARINLGYTEITAPISGRIGIAEITKGNYVTPASSALASIVQTDPVRVVFSVTDRAYLSLRQQILAGTASSLSAHVRLPNGTVLPVVGKKDFDDNMMSDRTGTMAVRFAFDNADGLLVAGGYVKVLLENPDAPQGIKIPQKAVLVDQQGSYVLTVDEAGKVSAARIKTGAQLGADVIVESGLKAGDHVVIDGVQKAVPGATVKVTLAEDGK